MTGQRLQAEHGMSVKLPKLDMRDKRSPAMALVVLAVPDYRSHSAIGESAGWVSVSPRHCGEYKSSTYIVQCACSGANHSWV